MVGNATFTIVESSTIMNCATATTARTTFALTRVGTAGAGIANELVDIDPPWNRPK
jgi:hypothetical protein